MRKILRNTIVFLLFLLLFPVRGYGLSTDQIYSKTAVLMDGDTGQVLFDKKMHETVYPASTTKIMTGLLVSELCDPSEVITVSQGAVDIEEWNSTNIALIPGEQLTVDDAMYALMLHSANDVANALAEHVAGSQERFVEMMNERAWQIGAYNTQFANAHGLHDPGHFTTGYDMALITLAASQNPLFMRYFGGDHHTMPGTNLQPQGREFTNYQSMLVQDHLFYYPGAFGGKVGYTTEAQHTMSTIALRDGRHLIATVMYSGERTEKFYDTRHLLDYGFSEFRQISVPAEVFESGVLPAENGEVSIYSEEDFTALLRNDLNEEEIEIHLSFPEEFTADDRLPSAVEVTIHTQDDTLPNLLGRQPLVSEILLEEAVLPAAQPSTLPPVFWGKSAEDFTMTPQFLAVLILSGILLILLAALIARYHVIRKRKREMAKRLGRRLRYPLKRSA